MINYNFLNGNPYSPEQSEASVPYPLPEQPPIDDRSIVKHEHVPAPLTKHTLPGQLPMLVESLQTPFAGECVQLVFIPPYSCRNWKLS